LHAIFSEVYDERERILICHSWPILELTTPPHLSYLPWGITTGFFHSQWPKMGVRSARRTTS